MTTPKQDLTVEEFKDWRRNLPRWLKRYGCELSEARLDQWEAICDLALKGIEAQKPEPSGEREDETFEIASSWRRQGCSGYPTAEEVQGYSKAVEPSPTPGDKDAVTAEDLAKGFVAFKDGKKITAEEFCEPSGSVEGLVERWDTISSPGHSISEIYEAGDALAKALKQLASKIDELRSTSEHNYRKGLEHHQEAIALSLEVGRLREALGLVISSSDFSDEDGWRDFERTIIEARNALAGGAE